MEDIKNIILNIKMVFIFICAKKKGKKSKWTEPYMIEKSNKLLVIDFDPSSEVGLKKYNRRLNKWHL